MCARAMAEVAEQGSALAHEIKNPRAAVSLALRAVARALGEEEQAVLGELVERLEGLEHKLRDALAYARECSPSRAAHRLEELAAELAPPLEVHVEAPTELDCDRELLQDALARLAQDALGAGARSLWVRALEEESGARLELHDDGPCPSAERLEELALPLALGRAGLPSMAGAMAVRAARLHEGALRAQPSPHGGVCWEFTLPKSAHAATD